MTRARQCLLDAAVAFMALAAPVVNQAGFTGVPLLSAPVLSLLAVAALAGAVFAVVAPPRAGLWRATLLAILLLVFVDGSVGIHAVREGAGEWVGVGGLVLAAMAVAAAATDRMPILAAFFGATLLASAATAPAGPPPYAAAATGDQPVILHLVLDGLQGPETLADDIPGHAEVGRSMRALADIGFQLRGNVRSTSSATEVSLTRTFNFDEGTPDRDTYLRGLHVTRNAWFDRLRQAGYAIEVFHRGEPDFCGQPAVARCKAYHSRGNAAFLGELSARQPNAAKRLLTYAQFLSHPNSISHWAFQNLQIHWLATGIEAAQPYESLNILEEALQRARRAPPGTAVFGHILLPHFPYGLDHACRIVEKPSQDWQAEYIIADERTRRQAWAAYYEQSRCLLSRLNSALADPGLRKAIVILHGDHGSRFVPNPPDWATERAQGIRHPDLHDTFVAIRVPGQAGGYDAPPPTTLPAWFKAVTVDLPLDQAAR